MPRAIIERPWSSGDAGSDSEHGNGKRCDSTPAEHGEQRATRPVVRSTGVGQPALPSEQRTRNTGTQGARGQPHLRRETRMAEWPTPVDQVAQDRSGSPARRDSVPLSV